MQLRNEFSVCRVYISTGTLRSFDRRPFNPPGNGQTAAARQHAPWAANTNLANDRVTANTNTGHANNPEDWRSLVTSTTAIDNFSLDMDFDQL
jgi:hypothetical protein